ncbi:MAG: beta-ketoacyl synthase [Bacteroidia bacterium]|nr:beta-ketoacyl synthase [Bacteroidia bacterium]
MYLNAACTISPQVTFDADRLPDALVRADGDRLNAIEPDYTGWIDARAIRRMSRVIRMGYASALSALKAAGVQVPDAIITGTAYGCLDDTGIFLSKMIEQYEEALNPTPFIQSTHNTIGSQVALFLKAYGYNQTYVHRAFSFENSLTDALMLTREHPDYHVLVGGVDEMTDVSYTLLKRLGAARRKTLGEGAFYGVVSGTPQPNSVARIVNVATLFKPVTTADVEAWIKDFLKQNDLSPGHVDLVLHGGDLPASLQASELRDFKTLCGEYPTATGFATWLAFTILKRGTLPEAANLARPVKTILIYNAYFGTHHSLILLQACRSSVL